MTARPLAACLGLLAYACTEVGVTFDDAWVRGARPGSSVAAGYCSITNHGADAVTIVEFRLAGSGRVEMHETQTMDGVSRMRPFGPLTITPGQTVDLAPGGKHLMLFDFDADSQRATLRAVLDDGTSLPVQFAVRPWN